MEAILLKALMDLVSGLATLGGGTLSTAAGLFAGFYFYDKMRNKNGQGMPNKIERQIKVLENIETHLIAHELKASERSVETSRALDRIGFHVERCPSRDGGD